MRIKLLRNISYLLCFCVVSSSLAGCSSLRKKFTRKKKKDFTAEFEPVLNPVDYPPMRESVPETYAYHASLRQVWYKGLAETLPTKDSDKRVKYFFDQMLLELNEMISLLTQEKKALAEGLLGKLQNIRKEYDRPSQMRQLPTIERRLRLLDGDIRDELKLDVVKDQLVPTL